MLPFNHILDFNEGQIQEVERRRTQRYVPGRGFPLQATIEIVGVPRLARIIDLAPGGAGLQVPGPGCQRDAQAKLHLLIEDVWLEFHCRIAHVRAMTAGCRVGLTACFTDFSEKKAYLQLLQPVAIGCAFRPVPAEEVRQVEPGLHKLVFAGRPGAELNVWCQGNINGPPQAFLWKLDDYLVQGELARDDLRIYSNKYLLAPTKKSPSQAFRKIPPKISDEIRRLFRWTMLNLSKEVPANIRTYLQGSSN